MCLSAEYKKFDENKFFKARSRWPTQDRVQSIVTLRQLEYIRWTIGPRGSTTAWTISAERRVQCADGNKSDQRNGECFINLERQIK